MFSIAMFLTTTIYTILLGSFFSDWNFVPDSVEELIAEGIGVILIFLSAIMYKLEKK